MTLLRSPAYGSMYIPAGQEVQEDRFIPRMDQGERQFQFWFNAGEAPERLAAIDREALFKNEKPYILSLFTDGQGSSSKPLVILGDDTVQMTAFKKAEKTDDYIIRLFEPTGKDRITSLSIPMFQIREEVSMGPFEIKTFYLDVKRKKLMECDLMEQILHKDA